MYILPQIYGFSLSRSTAQILYRLRQVDCCYVVFPNNIDHYLMMLEHDKPQYIFGMGTYSGVEQEKIRLETVCTNQSRNAYSDGDQNKELQLNPFLSVNSEIKRANAMGNSYCNLVSYKIMKLIEFWVLKSQYTFLHVPKKLPAKKVVEVVDQALKDFRLTTINTLN